MICENCHNVVYRKKISFINGKRVERCSECSTIFDVNLMVKVKGKRSAAHNNDISRRKCAPDGSVYRDYGRRSFVV